MCIQTVQNDLNHLNCWPQFGYLGQILGQNKISLTWFLITYIILKSCQMLVLYFITNPNFERIATIILFVSLYHSKPWGNLVKMQMNNNNINNLFQWFIKQLKVSWTLFVCIISKQVEHNMVSVGTENRPFCHIIITAADSVLGP